MNLTNNGGYDIYQTLTDEEVFSAWLNKIGTKKALAQKCQMCIPFDKPK